MKTLTISTKLLMLLLGISTSLFGKIIETPHFKEISHYLEPNTLVVLDIDDTLLIPSQTLGTDVWFLHRVKQLEAANIDKKRAFEKALAEWEAIRQLTDVSIVEEGTEGVISDLQKASIPVMGLTTQGLALATRTVQQLQSLGIDLLQTAPAKEDFYFFNTSNAQSIDKHGVLYRHGILFTSGTHKGRALLTALKNAGVTPQHIIFINDKEKHLKEVEETLEGEAAELGIKFTGLRYSFGDERVAKFNPALTDIQWKHSSFEHILSDSEAEALLKGS